jgi:hypothetical protein
VRTSTLSYSGLLINLRFDNLRIFLSPRRIVLFQFVETQAEML